MNFFVIIEKNKRSVPGEEKIREAMKTSGGTFIECKKVGLSIKVEFSGKTDHDAFENALIASIPSARRTSWNFAWADSDK